VYNYKNLLLLILLLIIPLIFPILAVQTKLYPIIILPVNRSDCNKYLGWSGKSFCEDSLSCFNLIVQQFEVSKSLHVEILN